MTEHENPGAERVVAPERTTTSTRFVDKLDGPHLTRVLAAVAILGLAVALAALLLAFLAYRGTA